jgi:hypothetical protein
MTVSPRLATIFGIWTSILLAIGSGMIKLTDTFPVEWQPKLVGWALFFGTINSMILTAFSGLSSPQSGPWVPTTPPASTAAPAKPVAPAKP